MRMRMSKKEEAMRRSNVITNSVYLAIILLLSSGCDASVSQDIEERKKEANVLSSKDIPMGDTVYTISGYVVSGYISNANVFLDINNNQKLDEDEPTTHTNKEGYYELNSTFAFEGHSLNAIGGIDTSRGIPFSGMLSANPITQTQGRLHITPISTLIDMLIKDGVPKEEAIERGSRFFLTDTEDAVQDPIRLFTEEHRPNSYLSGITLLNIIKRVENRYSLNLYDIWKAIEEKVKNVNGINYRMVSIIDVDKLEIPFNEIRGVVETFTSQIEEISVESDFSQHILDYLAGSTTPFKSSRDTPPSLSMDDEYALNLIGDTVTYSVTYKDLDEEKAYLRAWSETSNMTLAIDNNDTIDNNGTALLMIGGVTPYDALDLLTRPFTIEVFNRKASRYYGLLLKTDATYILKLYENNSSLSAGEKVSMSTLEYKRILKSRGETLPLSLIVDGEEARRYLQYNPNLIFKDNIEDLYIERKGDVLYFPKKTIVSSVTHKEIDALSSSDNIDKFTLKERDEETLVLFIGEDVNLTTSPIALQSYNEEGVDGLLLKMVEVKEGLYKVSFSNMDPSNLNYFQENKASVLYTEAERKEIVSNENIISSIREASDRLSECEKIYGDLNTTLLGNFKTDSGINITIDIPEAYREIIEDPSVNVFGNIVFQYRRAFSKDENESFYYDFRINTPIGKSIIKVEPHL
jgi:hypothetical protein